MIHFLIVFAAICVACVSQKVDSSLLTQYRILFEDYHSVLLYLPYKNYLLTFQDLKETISV
jgi:hypothetical protein